VLVPMAGVALVAYVVGIPILFGILLFLYRKQVETPQVKQWYERVSWCDIPDMIKLRQAHPPRAPGWAIFTTATNRSTTGSRWWSS
jgi:hypothetical protein